MQQELTLKGKTILLAATGGIAVYKSCELVRLLMKRGADVRVVMTENAAKFVTPLTFEALSGHPVVTSEWDTRSGVMPHIRLSDGADLIIVAPATANTIAKAACGIADNAVSTLICARRAPIAFAPAMNTRMWENPANTRNIETLKQDGIEVWGPAAGSLACGDTGTGRMLEPEEIASRTELFLHRKPLAGRRILITAGPTYEAIDPVRGITNRSSGRQGYAIAREAALRGEEIPARPPLSERVDVALRQFDLAAEDKGEHIACLEARKHFAWYLRGVPYSGYYKEKISSISTMDDIAAIAAGIKRDLR